MMKVVGRLGVVMAVLVGGVGVVVVPIAALAVIPLAAMAGFGYVAQRADSPATPFRCRADWATAGRIAGATIVGAYVLIGLGVLLGAAALDLAGLVAVAIWWRGTYVARLRRAASDGRPQPTRDLPTVSPNRVPQVALPVSPAALMLLSTPQLCRDWRTSYLSLATARDPSVLDSVAAVRRCYLDELERRDPAGFRRWIDDGARAAGDPARYLRRDATSSGGQAADHAVEKNAQMGDPDA